MYGFVLQAGEPISIESAVTRTLPMRPMRTPSTRPRQCAEDDRTIERPGELTLHRADQERPADRLADDDGRDQRDEDADQHERRASAGAPRG